MNILVVSFDKSLVNRLKDLLGDYNVIDVKNGEEAIRTVSSYVDVVIYDAVAGAISEEDINNMYRQKFKDPKYIILVDDLFPLDFNNLLPPKKIKVMRDEALGKIRHILFEEPGERIQESLPEKEEIPSFTIEGNMPFEGSAVSKEVFLPKDFQIETEKVSYMEAITPGLKKLALVSFDTHIINSIKESLSGKVEIIEVKNVKDAPQKAKEVDVIIFDTISGMLAQRILKEMSEDSLLANKPYILLLDELFTIDVSGIPLRRKYVFGRESELDKAVQKVLELIEELPKEVPQMPSFGEETPASEPEPSVMSLLEEIMKSSPEISAEEEKTVTKEVPINLTEDVINMIKETIKEQLSEDKLRSLLLQTINAEEIGKQLSSSLAGMLERVIKDKVEEILSRIDLSQIIREEARRVLREKLSELIT